MRCFYYIPQLCTGHVISPSVYSSLSFYVVLCFSLQNELQHLSFVVSFSVHSSVLWFALFNDVNLLPAGASAPHAGSGSEGPGDQLGALAEPSLLPTLRQKLWTPGLKGGKSRPTFTSNPDCKLFTSDYSTVHLHSNRTLSFHLSHLFRHLLFPDG